MNKHSDNDKHTEYNLELFEPFFDIEIGELLSKNLSSLTSNEKKLIEETPYLKWLFVGGKVYSVHRRATIRRLQKLLQSLGADSGAMRKFNELSPKEKALLQELIIEEVERMSDDRQGLALSFLIKAYLKGSINTADFRGLASETKNINPELFNFSERRIDIEVISQNNQRVTGNANFIPQLFTFTTSGGINGGLQLRLTDLGYQFFQHVYEPMKQAEREDTNPTD
jgi:hypothetical protein